MNELLQKHGCSNVFRVPEGLKELMSDITREVLRSQPPKIFDFIANYLSALIITREHGVMSVKILGDLCDCRPSLTEHLDAVGVAPLSVAADIAAIIQDEIEKTTPEEGDGSAQGFLSDLGLLYNLPSMPNCIKPNVNAIVFPTFAELNKTVQEKRILKTILRSYPLDEVLIVKVIQVARNAYREYWYRKRLLEQSLKKTPEEPWEKAAEYTLEIYKRTNPTFNELARATEKIQAAYRGYHVRRNLLSFKKKPKHGPKTDVPGPPLDVAGSREIDLGPVINLQVPNVDVKHMFEANARDKLGIPYDTAHLLKLVEDNKNDCACDPVTSARQAGTTPFSSEASHINRVNIVPEMNAPQSHTDKQRCSRISFAPTRPIVLGELDFEPFKVEEEHTLMPAGDTSDEEVDEDITDHTHVSGVQTASAETTDVEDDGNGA